MTADHLWYVGYGSNLLRERFHTYLLGSTTNASYGSHVAASSVALPVQEKWLWIDHALYFAGISRRWTGSPAFVSWERTPGTPSLAHAYLIERNQFAHVAAVENGMPSVDLSAPLDAVDVGDWVPLESVQGGKYDALLRLDDIDGISAWTVTSSIVRERGLPAERYLDTVRRGLGQSLIEVDVPAYLDAALERSATITLPDR